MDGYTVELNDIVWDILLETGQVVTLNADGSFVVAFGDRLVTYQKGGYYAGVKRLYWRNPILMLPQKGESKKWNIIRGVLDYLDKVL